MTKGCRLCGEKSLQPMIDLGNMPIAHRLAGSADEVMPVYPFRVFFCSDCGLPQIIDPIDPDILYGEYNYCFSDWKPQPHVDFCATGNSSAAITRSNGWYWNID